MTSKGKADTIVIVEWVLFVFSLIVAVLLIAFINNKEVMDAVLGAEESSTLMKDQQFYNTFKKILTTVLAVTMALYFFFTVLLTVGVNKGNTCSCKAWYIFTAICTGLSARNLIQSLLGQDYVGFGIQVVVLGYRIWAIRTIVAYTKEVGAIQRGEGVIYSLGPGQGQGQGGPGQDNSNVMISMPSNGGGGGNYGFYPVGAPSNNEKMNMRMQDGGYDPAPPYPYPYPYNPGGQQQMAGMGKGDSYA